MNLQELCTLIDNRQNELYELLSNLIRINSENWGAGGNEEECAEYMQISRATAQLVCDSARSKIASALVNGRGIIIEGGDYRLCDGKEHSCNCGGCKKHCPQDAL